MIPSPWPHLSSAFKQKIIPVKVVLYDLPKQEGKCLAELYVNQFKEPITEPGKILDQQVLLSLRQQMGIRVFVNSVAFSAKRDIYALSPTQAISLFLLANDIELEIREKGIVKIGLDPVSLKASLNNKSLKFQIVNHLNKNIEVQCIIGTDRAFILDRNLTFYNLEPFLTPLEVEKILFIPELSLDEGKYQKEFNSVFSQIARSGIDLNCLKTIAKKPKSQIMLRILIDKNNNVRLHLVNELSFDNKKNEVEIYAKGWNEPVFWFSDGTCVARQSELEKRARDYLLDLGAIPSNNHNGFQMIGAIGLNFLSHIANQNNLPTWLKIDQDCIPEIISLPLKPVLIAQESTNGLISVKLSVGDFNFSLKKLLEMINTESNALLLKDETVLTFNKQTIQSLKIITESLGINNFEESREHNFSEIALLIKMLSSDIELCAEETLYGKLVNFLPEIIPEDCLLPKTLKTSLRSYQHDSLIWMLQLHRAKIGRLLADEMGLGKTLMVLALIAIIKERENRQVSLVIAPTSVLDVWVDEAKKHFNDLGIVKLHGSERSVKLKEIENADVLITSYAILRRDVEKLSTIKFRYLIIDEAQIIKNLKTESWKAARLIQAEQKIALSGTPIENRLSDLYSILELVSPGILGKEHNFLKRYSGTEHNLELKNRIKPLIMRRKKEDVAKDLPEKIENILYCDMSSQQKAIYLDILHTARDELKKTVNNMPLLAILTRLRQICCDPRLLPGINYDVSSGKLDLFLNCIDEFLSNNRKIIVYSQFVKMQSILIESLRKKGIDDILWLHGSTVNRADLISEFQKENGPRIIIVSLKAGGTGITLTRADTVIYYDPWWNPAVMDQAADRAHRIGQTKTVHLVKLICRQSIEKQILDLCEKKRAIANDILSTNRPGKRSLTFEEIRQLLEFEIGQKL